MKFFFLFCCCSVMWLSSLTEVSPLEPFIQIYGFRPYVMLYNIHSHKAQQIHLTLMFFYQILIICFVLSVYVRCSDKLITHNNSFVQNMYAFDLCLIILNDFSFKPFRYTRMLWSLYTSTHTIRFYEKWSEIRHSVVWVYLSLSPNSKPKGSETKRSKSCWHLAGKSNTIQHTICASIFFLLISSIRHMITYFWKHLQ